MVLEMEPRDILIKAGAGPLSNTLISCCFQMLIYCPCWRFRVCSNMGIYPFITLFIHINKLKNLVCCMKGYYILLTPQF